MNTLAGDWLAVLALLLLTVWFGGAVVSQVSLIWQGQGSMLHALLWPLGGLI